MEFMGFQLCMNFLAGCGIVITTFISGRDTQIAAYFKTVLKHITQYFDLWHLKKSEIKTWSSTLTPTAPHCVLSSNMSYLEILRKITESLWVNPR